MTTATATTAKYPPLVRTVTLAASADAAFRRFTAEIGSWWPLATHSVGQQKAQTVEMQPAVGGQIIESIDGSEPCVWGTIVAWDPPRRVAFTWHPGHDAGSAQDIEVLFEPAGSGTLVTLTHTGFERLGKEARTARRAYPMGWTYVLGLYARRRGFTMRFISLLTSVVSYFARRRRR